MAEKVLLVDDESDFLTALSERMENRGMNVTTTTSPKDALSRIESETFDAIVLDMKMPEMDGLEALAAIKEKRPELQVIVLTGYATVEKGIQAIKLGAIDFLEKPIDINLLSEKIKKAQGEKIIIVERQTEEKIKQIIGGKGW